MTTPTQELCEQLELAAYHSPYWRKLFGESKSLIEDQASRIAELDLQREQATAEAEGYKEQHGRDSAELRRLCAERDKAKERVKALQAKCALLAASLDQSEREVEDLKHDIDRYQEITKAEVEHSASLEAQLQQRGEPVAWRSASFPDGFTTRKDVAERWRHEDGRVIELFDHPPASAAIENAFHLQCQLGINVEYDGSYVTVWKGEAEVTRECAEDDRMSATREAIAEVAARAGEECGHEPRSVRPPAAATSETIARPEWASCETRGAMIRSSLKHRHDALSSAASTCRKAYRGDYLRAPFEWLADAYDAAAGVLATHLAALTAKEKS